MPYSDLKDPKSFIAALQREIEDEAEAAREGCHKNWAKAPGLRIARGVCLTVTIINRFPNGRIVVSCASNDSRFRETDILRLNRGDPFEEPSWDVYLEREGEGELILSPGLSAIDYDLIMAKKEGWYLDESYLDLSAYYFKAIDDLKKTAPGQERVLPFLMGRLPQRISSERATAAEILAEEARLNASQEEALVEANISDVALLIQGPPGTGKTLLLALLVKLLVNAGERVLVTALTHRAIANALNKIADIDGNIKGVKVEPPDRKEYLAFPRVEYIDEWEHAKSKDGFVIGATPFACWTQRLEVMRFTSVVFDEASQITVPLAIMAMLRGRKYFFFGDQQQLPPVHLTRHGAERSVFGLLGSHTETSMLRTTYRLNRALTRWPSEAFYGGRLKCSDISSEQRITFSDRSDPLFPILDPERVTVLVPSEVGKARARNQPEASRIAEVCQRLVAAGLAPSEIGIVTPFRAQSRALRKALRKALPDQHKHIVADTVERMQGQERDLIILSLVTTDPTYAQSLATFYFQPQRLNVSITRARKKLIIFACPDLARFHTDDRILTAWLQQFHSLLNAADRVPWQGDDG